MKFADLHLHTSFSDGTYSPSEIVSRSIKAKLSAIAIADHDTVEGIAPCIDEAKGKDLEIIPAIELTAEYNSREVHFLGYFIDYKDQAFKDRLVTLKAGRIERIYKMVVKLKEMGVDLEPESIFSLSGEGTVGRLHVARAMEKEGIVSNIFEAFQKYIGDSCPAYVLGFRFDPQGAIKFIKDHGGTPVLAHPYMIKEDSAIEKFVEFGLRGLEVYYPEHTQSMVNFYLDFCHRHNLLVTGGSDCHGSAKPDVKIGDIKIDYQLVDQLRQDSAR